MDAITLLATFIALVLVYSLKRLFRLLASAPNPVSTFHKSLAVHIADTTRSAGRSF